MAFKHTITTKVTTGDGASVSIEKTYTGSSAGRLEEAIPIDASDLEVIATITVAQVVSLFITADQDLTLKTNSSGAPDDTISLKGNVPLVYNTDKPASGLLAADVTKFFVSNGPAAATLKMELIQDATP